MKNYYHVIGHPINHSLSPIIYNTLFEKYKLANSIYSKRDVTPELLDEFVQSIPSSNIKGFNVTMPLKDKIIPYLHEHDQSVLNGANTVIVKNNKLYGYSTDSIGFFKSLDMCNVSLKNSNIVFIGSGSVTQTLLRDAIKKSPHRITVVNRTLENAERISDDELIYADSLDNLSAHLSTCDLLVNTTPQGMEGCNHQFSDLSFLNKLKKSAFVYDLIYRPSKTKLLLQAEKNGNPTMNGLSMLIWQAFYAFELFCSILPEQEDFHLIYNTLTTECL